MQAFEWANAKSVDDAFTHLGVVPAGSMPPWAGPHVIGGGQDLHTTMKARIVEPSRVVNLKTIPDFDQITYTEKDGLTLGATATLTAIAEHPDVKKFVPGLMQAIESVASPQIRNLGTIGGNLCQKPRCWYYRLENVACLKRGGDTCYAKDGENKYHAVFGTDAPCVITQPSDPAQMLVALGAVVTVATPESKTAPKFRDVPAGEFFRMPTTDDAWRETVLDAGPNTREIVTKIRIPAGPLLARSTYLKFKERESLDFAMASVAAAIDLAADKTVRSARVVLGGVAPVPWQVPAVDRWLAGKPLDAATIAKAAEMAVDGAKPLGQNGYKVPLVKTLVRRALTSLA